MNGEVIYNIINGFYDRNTFSVSEDMELEEMFQEGSESSAFRKDVPGEAKSV